ncbi:MAG: hypothetical protein A4E66_00157 [Syntrophus sp. PtaB.Bin001]|nr:MAG: hypothetical protein A4E66_00157 [Syntrophus sp. PtaB.Bin001]
MKRMLGLMMIAIMFFMAVNAYSLTLQWDNPTTRVDGTVLTADEQAALSTVIEIAQVTDSTQTWTILATIAGGLNTYTGDIPSTYPKGSTVQFRAKSVLGNLSSDYTDAVAYKIPLANPNKPSLLIIISK